MAATHPMYLNLPADLYARIEEAAARGNQPIEAVLLESLALLFGARRLGSPGRDVGDADRRAPLGVGIPASGLVLRRTAARSDGAWSNCLPI